MLAKLPHGVDRAETRCTKLLKVPRPFVNDVTLRFLVDYIS